MNFEFKTIRHSARRLGAIMLIAMLAVSQLGVSAFATIIEATDHNLPTETGDADHNCSAKLKHYAEWEGTCAVNGNVELYMCMLCNRKYSDPSASKESYLKDSTWQKELKPHDLERTEAKAPTCGADGNYEYYTCKNCKKVFKDKFGTNEYGTKEWIDTDRPAHKLSRTDAVAATCTESGNAQYYTCSECKGMYTDEKGTAKTSESAVVVNALGHNLTKHAAVAASCSKMGNELYYSCSRCKKYYGDANATKEKLEGSWIKSYTHSMTRTAAKAPTCTASGNEEYYYCSKCKKYYRTSIGAPADVTTKSSMTIPAKGHNMTEHKAVETSCQGPGNKAYFSCDECSKFFSDADGTKAIAEGSWIIPASHNYKKTEAKKATCTEAGNDAYYYCIGCERYFNDELGANVIAEGSWVIDPKGHSTTKINAKTPTCEEAGNTEYFKCKDCEKTFEDAEARTEIEAKDYIIDATGHDTVFHKAVEGDCNTDRSRAYYSCKGCTKFFSDQEAKNEIAEGSWIIPAKHDMVATPAVKASCTARGNSAYYTCKECHRFFSDAAGNNQIAENSWELGYAHSMTRTAAKAPTCTANGNEEYYTCKKCKKYFADSKGELRIEKNSWVIKALGHNMDRHDYTQESCEGPGNKLYFSCDQCGKFFSDELGKKAIKANSWVIPAKHTLVKTAAKKATCLEDGNKLYYTCSHCNRYFSDTAAKKQIEENSWVIGALGHNFKKYKNKKPTCTADGYNQTRCSRCKKIETEVLTALGHDEQVLPAETETHFAAGKTEGLKCLRCKKVLVAQITIPKLKLGAPGVIIDNGNVVVDGASAEGATGYEVRYANASSMKSAKTIKSTGAAFMGASFPAAAGKTYYVQYRAAKKVGKKTTYSDWSAAASLTA